MSQKYLRALEDLRTQGYCQFKAFGHSMTPRLKSGSLLYFEAKDDYQVGDIVFCKVKGRFIDAHLVKKVDAQGRYLIANNHGFENGWTRTIYAHVVKVNGIDYS